jgi:hypothetical protein
MPNTDLENDPLKFWEKRNNVFFNKLIEKYFYTPYICTVRGTFFKSGQFLSERRSRLKSKDVNMLLFLNNNMNFEPLLNSFRIVY